VEDPADDPVAELRHAVREILDREAEGKQPRVLHLQAIVEDRHPKRGPALGVVGVHHGVDHRLAHGHERQVPALPAPDRSDIGAMEGMLGDARDRLLDRLHRVGSDLGTIHDPAPVPAHEAPRLDPGVREVLGAVPSEQQEAADGGDGAPLVVREHPQRPEVAAGELADAGEGLGSRSEVQRSESSPGIGCSSKLSPRVKRLAGRRAAHPVSIGRPGSAAHSDSEAS